MEATFFNRRKEDVRQKGREHAPLMKTLFHIKPPRAHAVVEPHACLHAIVELTNGRDHILWHAKTGEYCSEEGSINGVVSFGKVDKVYIERNLLLPRQLLQPTNHKHHIGGGTFRSETTLFLPQDPHAFTVLAEAASDDLEQYLAGMRYQRDAPITVALCLILLFVEYHDDGIFPLLRHLDPPPNMNDDIEQSPVQSGITVEGDPEQLNGDSVRYDSVSVRQRADGVCQLLHHGLKAQRHVFGPLVKTFCDVRVKPWRLGVEESVEPTDPSFADEFDVPQEDAVLVFDICRAAVSLPSQVHRIKVLVKAGLVAFSSACFEFANEIPKEAQHGSLAHLPNIFSSHLHGFSKVAVVAFCT